MATNLKFSIIIPVHDQFGLLDQCLQSVLKNTNDQYEIVLSDSGSNRKLSEYYGHLDYTSQFEYQQLKIIRDDKNPGFSRAINSGMQSANQDSEYYVWLNSDTIVTHGWLDGIGTQDLCSPISNNAAYQSMICADVKDLPNIEQFCMENNGDNLKVDLINGFCYIISNRVFQRVGYLDETHFPHYGSEDDYSLRAKLLGFQAEILKYNFVYHHGNQSYSQDSGSALRKNAKIFLSRYPQNWFDDLILIHKIKTRNLRQSLTEEFIEYVQKKYEY